MKSIKERGCPAESSPIPNYVVDNAKSKTFILNLQVSRLTRRCAISVAMAETLAPLAFGAMS
jgi:hypothetical protein